MSGRSSWITGSRSVTRSHSLAGRCGPVMTIGVVVPASGESREIPASLRGHTLDLDAQLVDFRQKVVNRFLDDIVVFVERHALQHH